MPLKIVIIGTGGVGGYFGGRLAQAGHDVTFVARGAHLQALRETGLRVDSVRGDFAIHSVRAIEDAREAGVADLVIICVKTWQLDPVIAALPALMNERTLVLPLLNGVEASGELARAIGPGQVLGGVAKIISFIAAPGHIRDLGGPASIAFGEMNGGSSARLDPVLAALSVDGIKAQISSNIRATLWEKFLYVVPVGGVGAVSRAPVGVLRRVPETRALLIEGMEEIRTLAEARGIHLAADITQQTMGFLETQPEAGTSSLQRDLMSGRRSELDAWSGAVVRLGRESGVATPVHSFLYSSLLPLERRARGELAFA